MLLTATIAHIIYTTLCMSHATWHNPTIEACQSGSRAYRPALQLGNLKRNLYVAVAALILVPWLCDESDRWDLNCLVCTKEKLHFYCSIVCVVCALPETLETALTSIAASTTVVAGVAILHRKTEVWSSTAWRLLCNGDNSILGLWRVTPVLYTGASICVRKSD